MTRIASAAAVLMLAFSASPASAGLFSKCHQNDCCEPSCAVPSCSAPCETGCAPSCAMPYSYGPSCAVPSCGCPDTCGDACGGCGEVYCDGCCAPEKDCCLKRVGKKLWSLEKRKNACLLRTFFGKGCHDECHDGCGGYDCAPVEYYQPGCAAPSCGLPASACGCR